MRCGLAVFCRTLRVRGRTLLLYAVGVALSVATILIVTALSTLVTTRVDGELDRILLNGVQVKVSALSPTAANDAVARACEGLRHAPLPVAVLPGRAEGETCTVWGVGASGGARFSLRFRVGRFFSRAEEDAAAPVCVIGATLSRTLFGTADGIGTPLRLAVGGVEETFRVVGVYEDGAAADWTSTGAVVYLPHTLAAGALGRESTYWLAAEEGLTAAAARLKAELGADVVLTDYTGQRAQIRDVFTLVTRVLTWISAVSLLVAAVNLRVVTRIRLKSQVRQIGLKKSIGAADRDLLWESVFEAVAIALTGVALGALLGGGACLVLCAMGACAPFPTTTALTVTGAAVLLSVAFCLPPAWRAARLPPAQTLRQEE